MESKEDKKNTSPFLFSFLAALVVSLIAFSFIVFIPNIISSEVFFSVMPYVLLFGLPIIAYLISVLFSVAYQYNKCKSVQVKSIFINDLFVLLSNFGISLLLFIENLPIKKYIFGEYLPQSDETGTEVEIQDPEEHYRIKFFSGIVQNALPSSLSLELKKGFSYMYWSFFMTLLPTFFVFNIQSFC
jgi:hypothetical protein